jgi:hypothetical protein
MSLDSTIASSFILHQLAFMELNLRELGLRKGSCLAAAIYSKAFLNCSHHLKSQNFSTTKFSVYFRYS